MPASRFLKIVQETSQIPVCSFYLPVSTSRNPTVRAATHSAHCCNTLGTLLQHTGQIAATHWTHCCNTQGTLLQHTGHIAATHWAYCLPLSCLGKKPVNDADIVWKPHVTCERVASQNRQSQIMRWRTTGFKFLFLWHRVMRRPKIFLSRYISKIFLSQYISKVSHWIFWSVTVTVHFESILYLTQSSCLLLSRNIWKVSHFIFLSFAVKVHFEKYRDSKTQKYWVRDCLCYVSLIVHFSCALECQLEFFFSPFLRWGGTPHDVKGGPEPLEKEINEILGSKREDRFSNPFFELVQNTTLVRFSYLRRLCNFCKAPRACESSCRSARR